MTLLASHKDYTSLYLEEPQVCSVCGACHHFFIYRRDEHTLKSSAMCMGCDTTMTRKEAQ